MGKLIPIDEPKTETSSGGRLIPIDEKESNIPEMARGIGANLIQGATFGTGGTLSGLSNIMANPAYKISGTVLGKETPRRTISEQFKSGKEAFELPEMKFAKEYPKTAIGLNIAGGLPLGGIGAVKGGLLKATPMLGKMGIGALEGAGFGALAGAGSELSKATENVLNKKTVPDLVSPTAKGLGVGAGLGAVAPLAIALPFGIAKGLRSVVTPKLNAKANVIKAIETDTTQAVQKGTPQEIPQEIMNVVNMPSSKMVKNHVPMDFINRSIKSNTPLIEQVNPGGQIHRLAMQAKLNNEDAATILSNYARPTMEKMPKDLLNVVDETLGSKSHFKNLDEIEAVYKKEANPLYEKARSYGDLSKLDPTLSEFVKTPKIANEIAKARKSDLGIGLEKVPDTDIRLLDIVKQNIDDDIGKYLDKTKPEPNKARNLQEINSELKSRIDSLVPEYGQARQVSSDYFKLKQAQEIGGQVLRGETPESIERIVSKMNPAEREALKIGFRDEIVKQISQAAKSERVNVAMRVFGETENYLGRQNMKAILGDKDYTALMEKVSPIVRRGRVISDLMEGSQTAEKTATKIPRGAKFFIKKALGKAITSQTGQQYPEIARMLVDPNYLKSTFKKGVK